ncbi:MAG: hypothetical protein IJ560_00230, partial [Alphaproteobacteria bacterium]|nr:hypothetical protein [Alphaproteobacteria bacterium]
PPFFCARVKENKMADFWGFVKTICAPKKRWFFGARLISLYAIYYTAFARFWQYVFYTFDIIRMRR